MFSLDRKLAAALTKIANGEIGRQITQATTTALNKNMVARGRVLLAFVSVLRIGEPRPGVV